MKKLNLKPTRTHYIIFFAVIILFLLILILANWNFGADKNIIWGATFSKKQSDHLDIVWKLVYSKMIDEMPFKILRIPIYWDEIEKKPGEFDFSDYTWMFDLARSKEIEIVPVIGRRVPRWPECHTPEFYQNLSSNDIKQKILNLITLEIEQFKSYDNIKKWQIDNEPFLDFFGECPLTDENLIKKEIALVRELDARPILITESGELSSWLNGARLADILGVSMYRETWNKNWGWFQYPLPPAYYYFKGKIVQRLTHVKKIINTELQAEPWAEENDLTKTKLQNQLYGLDLLEIKSNLKFAKKAGQDEIYIWGVEWWWWLGQKHNQWDIWEYFKTQNF